MNAYQHHPSSLPTECAIADGVHNMRGFGGHLVEGGTRFTRTGILFRSGQLTGLTLQGQQQLQDLRISTVIDLRSDSEIVMTASTAHQKSWEPPLAANSSQKSSFRKLNIVRIPVYQEKLPLPTKLKFYGTRDGNHEEIIVDEYFGLATSENGTAALRAVLLFLLKQSEPILVHCSLGKDRTGVIFAVILRLVGVDHDAIAHDYSLSQDMLQADRPRIEKWIRFLKPSVTGDELFAYMANITNSQPEYMLGFLHRLEQQYGSVAEYVRTCCGMSCDEMERLLSILTVTG